MILSHSKKFVFIKTRKTAGTSIELALSPFLEPGDIATRLVPEDESLREGLLKVSRDSFKKNLKDWSFRDVLRIPITGWPHFTAHSPARDVIKYIGFDCWNDYSTFCVERNSFDKVISAYYWRRSRGYHLTLDQFIFSNALVDFQQRSGWPLYAEGNKILVDQIFQYHNLQEAKLFIANDLIGFEELQFPRAKSQKRPSQSRSSNVLNEFHIERISEVFQKEISVFKYKCEF